MIVMKAEGAFLTIGELSAELGVPQHILRYWESRFPELRPLQRSGNRRYYRPADVALTREIHRLLNVEGFTVRGAQKALAGSSEVGAAEGSAVPMSLGFPQVEPQVAHVPREDNSALIAKLEAVRNRLADALS